ncbi:MAG: hypothetical protein ACRDRX_06870 [Pseudonocardiaceae bacterium]
MPAELRRWVTHQLPGLASVVDVFWPYGCSRVWRVASGTDEVYVKRSPGRVLPQRGRMSNA